MVCARVATVIPKHNAILTVFAAASPRQLPHPTKTKLKKHPEKLIAASTVCENPTPSNDNFYFGYIQDFQKPLFLGFIKEKEEEEKM